MGEIVVLSDVRLERGAPSQRPSICLKGADGEQNQICCSAFCTKELSCVRSARLAQECRGIENVFIYRILRRRGAAVRIQVLQSRMARIF